MKVQRTTSAAATFATVLAMQACGSPGTALPMASPPARSPEATAELEALYRARSDSALTSFTEADVHFMGGMIAHHAQALTMSRMAPTHGAHPSVLTLAARTINAQQDEIATMRRWLGDRRQAEHDMGVMPGMLSDDQMRELDRARGAEFDRLFLTYMIQHHGGAVAMVHELFATDGAALGDTVFKVASDIQVDQESEIDRMERMLQDLPATGLRP